MAPRVKSLADDNLKSKKSVFKQRFPGFKKKATELSVLCGNSVGFICYGPDEKDLHVWPENPKSMEQIVARFTAQSDLKRKKNSCDLDDFPNLEGLSVEELTNHLSCINSHLEGIKQKKVQIMIKRIKGSSDQKNTVSVSGEDRSRVSLSENGTDQKSNPNLVSKDHLLKVSDQNTKLGFGGVFDELGYVVRGSSILVESVSDPKYETLGVASNDRVMGMEAGGEEAEHYPNSFTNDVDVWDFDYSSPLTRYSQTPIADYWGNIQGFVTPTTSMI